MKNSKGFALLEALLIFVMIGALVGVGWYVYQKQDSNDSDNSYTYGTNAPEETEEPEVEKVTVTELDVDTIVFKEDLEDLPNEVTEDFNDFLAAKLVSKSDFDPASCKLGIKLNKVSQVNASGGLGEIEVDQSGNQVTESLKCNGGGYQFWGLNNDGEWSDGAGGHTLPGCDELYNPKIYKEFSESCYANESDFVIAENPNGSIYDVEL